MRMDVKLGVVFSMAIVLLLGGYFVFPRGQDKIPLTGDVKPTHDGGPTSQLAANPGSQAGRTATPATKSRGRLDPKRTAKPSDKTGRSGPRTSPTRLADRPQTHGRLPVSGTSLAGGSTTSQEKPTSPVSREAATLRSAENVDPGPNRPNETAATAHPSDPPFLGAQVASGTMEKPGTPPPPGLLAATRIREPVKNQPAVDLHRVQPGDTFAKLAETYYGSVKHVEFLMKANPQVDPGELRIGMTIRVPALSATARTPAPITTRKPTASPPARTYTVQAGDSFYRIAERELGGGSRWEEIYALNRKLVGDDPSRLKIGQVLILPSR